jgi:threonine dehydrogenase-like Zn-dependent dehydrogenase
MRGVVFLGEGELEVRDFPKPVPGPGEVLIEMRASGICGSDLHTLRRPKDQIAAQPKTNPPGHEPCGVVAALGPGVAGMEVGHRVMVFHYAGCGRCKYCRIGYEQLCIHGHSYYGASHERGYGGGHEDFMVAPARVCMDLPDGMSFEAGAAISCGTGTAYAALKRLAVSGRDTLTVFGQGPVGLSATLLGAAMGARVIAIDVVPYRLELAKKLGAAEVVNARTADAVKAVKELTHGEGAEATLECTAVPAVRVQTIDSAKLFGRACFVGEGGSVAFENVSQQIIHKHLTIYGSWTFATWMLEEAANWILDRRVPIDSLITHRYPLEQAKEAYRVFQEGVTGKVVFTWKR